MKRENVKKNIGIISAFADGKTIQILNEIGEWVDLTEREGLPIGILEEEPNNFRIKPEFKYRPFKDAEECWQEMLKHQPFGWVKMKDRESGYYILKGIANQVVIGLNETPFSYKKVFEDYIFVDGTPFGVKVEE
mgnify:CR=1 FL=1